MGTVEVKTMCLFMKSVLPFAEDSNVVSISAFWLCVPESTDVPEDSCSSAKVDDGASVATGIVVEGGDDSTGEVVGVDVGEVVGIAPASQISLDIFGYVSWL